MSEEEKTYQANCHCGKIRYSARLSPPLEQRELTSCNCSICRRNGTLQVYPDKDRVTFLQGKDEWKEYQYLGLKHYFCPNCGTPLISDMADPNHEWASAYALNVRAFRDVDLDKLKVTQHDGWSKDPQYSI